MPYIPDPGPSAYDESVRLVTDGYEATRRIRAPDSGVLQPTVPIVAMTANAMKGDREICIEAGMNDYISKPIKREVVFEIIERWLHHELGR